MNTGSRRSLWTKNEVHLPYDSEVQWLEHVGTARQFIDFGFKPSFSDAYDFEAVVYSRNY